MTSTVTFLVSSGDGPAECRQAIAHILDVLAKETKAMGIGMDVAQQKAPFGPKSALVSLHSTGALELANRWIGTIKWTCRSDIRPGHRRQNWFVGVFEIPQTERIKEINSDAFRFETFRAGGPGGQHQNSTDSAVRATCLDTGLSVVVRDGRSQHRNKSIAILRLQSLLKANTAMNEATSKQQQNHLHHQLERGNPVREFKGPTFKEVT